jgi:hypothetical protein
MPANNFPSLTDDITGHNRKTAPRLMANADGGLVIERKLESLIVVNDAGYKT